MGFIWSLIVGGLIGLIAGAITKKVVLWDGLRISLQVQLVHQLVKHFLGLGDLAWQGWP